MQAQEAIDNFDPALELDKIWDDQKTEWFDKDVKPSVKGTYEVSYDAEWPNSGIGMAEWTDAIGNRMAKNFLLNNGVA